MVVNVLLTFSAVAAVGVAYILVYALYQLFFSPLSRIPGPRYAAVSRGYEMYWDLIEKARFPWQLLALHEKYGK